jgi:hypothetical protein
MGILDTILGRTKPVRANLDALFSLPSAAVTLEAAAGLVVSGAAGVCWKPPAGQSIADLQSEIAQLLDIPDDQSASDGDGVGRLSQAEDSFGYRWLLLDDPDVENLVNRVHLINSTLTEAGWGQQLLCSVFGLKPGPDAASDARPLFLVYLYKRGTFYPFAPDGDEHRDNELELRVRAVVGSDLPTEPDLSRWFPLWDLPVR